MAIFLNENSKIIVQGITGGEGTKHTKPHARVRGARSSAASTPARPAPRSTSTARCCRSSARWPRRWPRPAPTSPSGSCRRPFTKDSVIEAIDAEIPLAVVITEGIPVHDTADVLGLRGRAIDPHHRPELSRADQPRQVQRRHHPGRHHQAGPHRAGLQVGHADLPDDVRAARLRLLDRVGIGGDPIIGTTHIDCLAAFQDDPETDAIVMIGEIGGDAEERAAAYIQANVTKPVVGYVAGFTAPEGKTMGHAGAIVSGFVGHRRRRRRRPSRPPGSRSARRRARPPG